MLNTSTVQFAKDVRKISLKMVHEAKSSHIGGAFSMIDILAVLYNGVLNIDPKNSQWKERDIFLLSKGHACVGLYATLALRGFFPLSELDTFSKNGSPFLTHASSHVPGVDLSTGSLGHALSVGCGLAISFKKKRNTRKVYCLLSDGELDEGSNWEAILFAPHHHLNNLVAIVDYNKVQENGPTNEIKNLEPLTDKWAAFGWNVLNIDGHNIEALMSAFDQFNKTKGKPTVILANTIKGKGISFMEGKCGWHGNAPNKEQLAAALAELK